MKTLQYAIRFLMRSKAYTIINLLGLSFSLACCMVLARYVHRELTVDTHCVDRENVYGVINYNNDNKYLSEIRSYNDSVIIDPSFIETKAEAILYAKEYVMEENHRYLVKALVADSLYLKLFHYDVVKGEAKLKSPHSVLLIEDYAQKIYGNQNPIGKVLKYSNGKELQVEGVIKRPSNKTSINCDIILSIDLSKNRKWDRVSRDFYVFKPGVDIEKMNAIGSVPRYLNDPQYDTRTYTFSFIPMKDVYWTEGLLEMSDASMWNKGHRSHLLILEGVGLLLLFTGLLNFINLYFITMVKRGRGYALRKVFGAGNRQLFSLIYIENLLLIAASLLCAWLWQGLAAGYVHQWIGLTGTYQAFDVLLTVGILFILPLLTSLYPYYRYSRNVPVTAIRSERNSADTVRTRMFFLGIQYALTFILIVLSFYFNKQLNLLTTTDPGFRTNEIIIANLVYESNDFSSYNPEIIKQRQMRVRSIDEKLNACPDIMCWEANFSCLIDALNSGTYIGKDGKTAMLSARWSAPALFDVFDLKFVEGGIPNKGGESSIDYTVVNRAGLKALGYDSLEGAMLSEKNPMVTMGQPSPSIPIAGVVDDFYCGHLSAGKQPMVFFVIHHNIGDVYQIACVPGRQQAVLDYLRKLEQEVYGTEDFEYMLLEDKIDEMYREDRRVAAVYSVFAFIAIIISSMGLFGISLFDIRQRYKEIGIRKVNGAKVMDIWRLLFRKYLVVLGSAFAVAVPVVVLLIQQVTEDLVVKAPLGIGMFLVALLLVALISLGTLFWQVNRAARINPSEVVKSE